MIEGFQYFNFFFFLVFLTPGTGTKEYHHPLYVAVAEIEYNSTDKFATLSCKMFADDLESGLQKMYAKKISTTDPGNAKEVASGIEAYIRNHVQLKINESKVNFVFIDYKKDDNTISAHFRINNIAGIQKFEVTDTIFYELYDKQMQMVYVTVNGNRKSNHVINPESKVSFDF